MTVFKIVQKIDSVNIPTPGGISTSLPIPMKTGYIRITPTANTYIEVGPNPGINTTNCLWVPGGESVILKEEWGSKSFVGIETGSTTTIIFQAGTGGGFIVGDVVAISGASQVGVNTNYSTVVSVDNRASYDSPHGTKLSLDLDTSGISTAIGVSGELRKVVKVAAANASSGPNTIHIMEVQVNAYS
jgi:hypothetical protein